MEECGWVGCRMMSGWNCLLRADGMWRRSALMLTPPSPPYMFRTWTNWDKWTLMFRRWKTICTPQPRQIINYRFHLSPVFIQFKVCERHSTRFASLRPLLLVFPVGELAPWLEIQLKFATQLDECSPWNGSVLSGPRYNLVHWLVQLYPQTATVVRKSFK